MTESAERLLSAPRYAGTANETGCSDLNITKALPTPTQPLYATSGNWWWPIIREPFTGAWQRNVELRAEIGGHVFCGL